MSDAYDNLHATTEADSVPPTSIYAQWWADRQRWRVLRDLLVNVPRLKESV